MAGHSKWANIKHRKGAQDKKRGVLFSKLSRAITVAAKSGLPDPDANATLAQAIQAAKDVSMPKDNIERAIAKGAAGAGEGDNYESVVYEGYGPQGVAIIAECLTDNRNRTAAEIRHAFSKYGGSLGPSGCVPYMFTRMGELGRAEGADEEAALMAAADAGADDIATDGGITVVTCEPAVLMAARKALEEAGFGVTRSESVLRPGNTVEVDEDGARKMLKMIDVLEELDDVQTVTSNFDVSDEVMEALDAE
ncbi:MAG: YebC/PmpR family DNA-binding transcriptional regulator [Thermoleophilia bacterium]|nr:YebC/PmpR family DNA-binding transcriptional regulator [Thermoleophilia bacterium]